MGIDDGRTRDTLLAIFIPSLDPPRPHKNIKGANKVAGKSNTLYERSSNNGSLKDINQSGMTVRRMRGEN